MEFRLESVLKVWALARKKRLRIYAWKSPWPPNRTTEKILLGLTNLRIYSTLSLKNWQFSQAVKGWKKIRFSWRKTALQTCLSTLTLWCDCWLVKERHYSCSRITTRHWWIIFYKLVQLLTKWGIDRRVRQTESSYCCLYKLRPRLCCYHARCVWSFRLSVWCSWHWVIVASCSELRRAM